MACGSGISYFLKIKFIKSTTLCLLYQAWRAKTTCRVKGGDGIKKFEKHWSRASTHGHGAQLHDEC